MAILFFIWSINDLCCFISIQCTLVEPGAALQVSEAHAAAIDMNKRRAELAMCLNISQIHGKVQGGYQPNWLQILSSRGCPTCIKRKIVGTNDKSSLVSTRVSHRLQFYISSSFCKHVQCPQKKRQTTNWRTITSRSKYLISTVSRLP